MSDKPAPKGRFVDGGGGVGIFAQEWGVEDGPEILFIHGFSQSHACWTRQSRGALAATHRLVAMDLRGHGYSEKPREASAYHDSAAIARDVQAVIEGFGLKRPALVGWSYGGVIIGDYLRAYGDAAIAGVVTVGAVAAVGNDLSARVMGPGAAPFGQLLSLDFDKQLAGARAMAASMTATPDSPEEQARAVAMMMMAPPPVRRGMLTRVDDHQETYRALTKPHLVIHGASDTVVLPAMADIFEGLAPKAEKRLYEGVGHAPSTEAGEQFDADLAAFCDSLSS